MFKEYDLVEMKRDIKILDSTIKKGSVGTIVWIYNGGRSVEVEFKELNLSGVYTISIEDISIKHESKINSLLRKIKNIFKRRF